jgi:hypothetical protein
MTITIPPTITLARGPADMDHIRALFTEYQQWLGVDLCFQGFDEEMIDLPGRYAEPEGRLLLAREGETVTGGVGMWPLGQGHNKIGMAEMKRLYVRPPYYDNPLEGVTYMERLLDDGGPKPAENPGNPRPPAARD